MPDLLRIRYVGDGPAEVVLAGREIGNDCVFDVPGVVVEELDDCWEIETGNPPVRRALAKSLYRVETPRKTTTKKE